MRLEIGAIVQSDRMHGIFGTITDTRPQHRTGRGWGEIEYLVRNGPISSWIDETQVKPATVEDITGHYQRLLQEAAMKITELETLSHLESSLDEATGNSINAEENEVKIALRLMCLRARITFGEKVRYIVLDDSDQGRWAAVNDVTDEGGNSVLGDGLGDDDDGYWEDGETYASHLYDNRVDVWKPYLVEGTWGGRRNPGVGKLDIEKVFEAMDKGEL